MTEPKRIVTNTGPLVALAGIGHLDLLGALYDDVRVPEQVHHEVLEGGTRGYDLSEYHRAHFLIITSLTATPDPILSGMLDKGEAAVIQLARQEQIVHILIDERKGRKIARQVYGLTVLGTMRLLIDAKRGKLLGSIREPVQLMRENGYWIHETIVEAALREAGEG